MTLICQRCDDWKPFKPGSAGTAGYRGNCPVNNMTTTANSPCQYGTKQQPEPEDVDETTEPDPPAPVEIVPDLRPVIEGFVQVFSYFDSLDCDHAAGLCVCKEKEALKTARAALTTTEED